jgi:hypothetical protein
MTARPSIMQSTTVALMLEKMTRCLRSVSAIFQR